MAAKTSITKSFAAAAEKLDLKPGSQCTTPEVVIVAKAFAKWDKKQPLGMSDQQLVELLVLTERFGLEVLYECLVKNIAKLGLHRGLMARMNRDEDHWDQYRKVVLSTTGVVHHDLAKELAKNIVPTFTVKYYFGGFSPSNDLELFGDQLQLTAKTDASLPIFANQGRHVFYGASCYIDGCLQKETVAAPQSPQIWTNSHGSLFFRDNGITREFCARVEGNWQCSPRSPSGRHLIYNEDSRSYSCLLMNPGDDCCKSVPGDDKPGRAYFNGRLCWTDDENHLVSVFANKICILTISTGHITVVTAPENHTVEAAGSFAITSCAGNWFVSNLFESGSDIPRPLKTITPCSLTINHLSSPLKGAHVLSDSLIALHLESGQIPTDIYAVAEIDTTLNARVTMNAILHRLQD